MHARFPQEGRRADSRALARAVGLRHVVDLFDPRKPDGRRELCRDAASDPRHRQRFYRRGMDGRVGRRARPRRQARRRHRAQRLRRGAQCAENPLRALIGMVEIRRSTIIEAPIESVWATLRDFNGHERWHPAVAASVIEEGAAGDAIGAVRNFRLADGARIREQLLALSDIETSFTYCILEAPVPLRNYVASVRLRRVTSDETCLLEWRASFDPPPPEEQRLPGFVARGINQAGRRA